MTEPLVEKARAKINLTLRVLGRRADGYHDLESLVAFADLADTLTLQAGPAAALETAGPFAGPSGPTADNLVLKAVAALAQRVDGVTAGRFLLEKNLPVAAGIGGGSADAAAALRLLARVNRIDLADPRLTQAALAVGADVPVCLASLPRIMRGVGDKLSPPLDLPAWPAVLINAGVALSTRDVFAKFASGHASKGNIETVPRAADAMIDFLGQHGNDLTVAAVACVPVIAEVLFNSAGEAAAAAWLLQAAHPDWWIRPATIG
jgi:4-diphosphocytidyl-2-C-methyl-D-erythritol kinase